MTDTVNSKYQKNRIAKPMKSLGTSTIDAKVFEIFFFWLIRMGKESSRLVLGATSVVLLLVIFLLYAAYFTSDVNPFDSCNSIFFMFAFHE